MPDKGVVNTAKGCKDHDLSQDAWKIVSGQRCYIQRTIMFAPDSISFPHKYLDKLPCLVRIEQRYKRGANKGKKMYPDLYVLSKPVVLSEPLRIAKNGRGGIQKSKCDGYVIPIKNLQKHI